MNKISKIINKMLQKLYNFMKGIILMSSFSLLMAQQIEGETENQRQLRLIMEEMKREYAEVDKRMKMHKKDYEDEVDRINKRSTEPITNYTIIKIEPISSNNSDLGNSVIDDLIVRGWQPYGPPYVDNENNHHQPFVKYRKKYDY